MCSARATASSRLTEGTGVGVLGEDAGVDVLGGVGVLGDDAGVDVLGDDAGVGVLGEDAGVGGAFTAPVTPAQHVVSFTDCFFPRVFGNPRDGAGGFGFAGATCLISSVAGTTGVHTHLLLYS